MKVSSVQETGSHNLLNWAIENGVSIKDDPALQSIINDELCFLVGFDDVNFFEMFRLVQMYREKLRIIKEYQVGNPDMEMIQNIFPGEHTEENGEKIPLSNIAKCSIESFINLALQMSGDQEAIPSSAARMFFPMFCRRFEVRIPIGVVELVSWMKPEEADAAFGEYPASMEKVILDPMSNVNMMLRIGFDRSTNIIRYDKDYDRYLQMFRYKPLSVYNHPTLFKAALISFGNYDSINCADVRCSLYRANKDMIIERMKKIANIPTPLKAEFAIQLPIQYMMLLMNNYSREELPATYESSMANIVDSSIDYNDFVVLEEGADGYEERMTAIKDYQVRIADANNVALNALGILLNQSPEVDIGITDVFSLLPSIYTTRAVITVNYTKVHKFAEDSDPVIGGMFQYIANAMDNLYRDIVSNK